MFPSEPQVSNNAKNLISKMLIVNPTKRLTLEQIKNHPFLTDTKIPTTLPMSIFSNPPSCGFMDGYKGATVGSNKVVMRQ